MSFFLFFFRCWLFPNLREKGLRLTLTAKKSRLRVKGPRSATCQLSLVRREGFQTNLSQIHANKLTENAMYCIKVIERRTLPIGTVLLSDLGGGRGKFATVKSLRCVSQVLPQAVSGLN